MSPVLSPHAPTRRRRANPLIVSLGATSVAAVALIVLASLRDLAPGPAIVAVVLIFAGGYFVWLASERSSTADPVLTSASIATQPAMDAPLGEAVEALPDPVLVIGGLERDDFAGRRILFANMAARELFRLPTEGALLVAAVRNPEVLEVVDEALFGGLQGEAAYEAGGVQERYWRAWARPLSPGPALYRRALLVLRDETDARRNERMRADFLANASHELRTPLASLAGFIDTLQGHARDDTAARDRFLGIMAAQAWRMARLIEDLMSLSRIELNEHIRPEGTVDLALAVADVADALAPQAREAGVRIEMDLPGRGTAVAAGDWDQIVQVVQNLADNAIKYAGRGGCVGIEVKSDLTVDQAQAPRQPQAARLSLLTPDHADERYGAVRVTDTGPGLKREHLPRLTERFYRVEGQKSGERHGTGLGLAIVKHIMNRHRGGLAVESVEGEGATFVVYIPLAKPRASGAPMVAGPGIGMASSQVIKLS